jgi:hypothetical protein
MVLAFKFDMASLISLILGIFLGLVIAILIYLLLVLTSMNKNKKIFKPQVKDVDSNEVVELINNAKDEFKDNKLRGEQSYVTYAIDISKKLIYQIAKKFYPNSRHPLLEISIDEALMLISYISKRLDEVLAHNGLKFLKRFKISFIVSLYDIKENFMENDIVKATRKYKISNAFNAAKNVLNIINPVYWIRKVVMNKAINIILKKLCVVMISVSGEETYKIYSKSIYAKESEIDSCVAELVDDLSKTVKEEEDLNKFDSQLDIADEENKGLMLIENNNEPVKKKKKGFWPFRKKE